MTKSLAEQINWVAQEYAWDAIGDMGRPDEDYADDIQAFKAGAKAMRDLLIPEICNYIDEYAGDYKYLTKDIKKRYEEKM